MHMATVSGSEIAAKFGWPGCMYALQSLNFLVVWCGRDHTMFQTDILLRQTYWQIV